MTNYGATAPQATAKVSRGTLGIIPRLDNATIGGGGTVPTTGQIWPRGVND
jgi:hypothetical protein